MCRLYGFKASQPSRIDCDLIDAQNSLVRQSEEDRHGRTSPDGWGMGLLRDGEIRCQREVSPAYESDVFRAGAADPRRMRRLLQETAEDVVRWHAALGSGSVERGTVALNVLWARGDALVGLRLGRSLGYVERRGSHRCGACGEVHGGPDDDFRAVAVASEQITDENWKPVPPASALHVTRHHSLEVVSLDLPTTFPA